MGDARTLHYKFGDLVDIPKLNNLMRSFYRATGIPSGIIDIEGTVLVAVGWRDICLNFHRQCPEAEKNCILSDGYVANHIGEANPYVCYTCKNGLVDAAAPIIINDVHVATVFQGQFFLEKPDVSYFECQAEHYGFDKEAYLAALAKVPIYTTEKLDSIMGHFVELASMLAEKGLTRLKQLEQQARELQRADDQIFMILNSTPDIAIQGYDEYGAITFWNNASEHMYGFTEEEVIGKPPGGIFFDNRDKTFFLDILKKIAVTNSLFGPVERKMRHKNGQVAYFYSTLFPIKLARGRKHFICMDVDITAQKNYTKELERLDRLNVVGEMAISLGHEIRNPLTTVRGYLQMIQNKHTHPEHADQFALMINEIDRADAIIIDFLSLAKNKAVEKKVLNLNNIVTNTLPLVTTNALMNKRHIATNLSPVPDTIADEKEIRQCLLNLVANGLDVTPENGLLTIETSVDSRGRAVLCVRDQGPGIPKNIEEKLGTPFISTKPNGTGLGLAVCYSVASRHKAVIDYDTSEKGTAFYMRFYPADTGHK